MIIVGRPINGITINGLEYISDGDNGVKKFKDEEEAKKFLNDNGITDFEDLIFKEV